MAWVKKKEDLVRKLYIQGVSLQEIADTIGSSLNSLGCWLNKRRNREGGEVFAKRPIDEPFRKPWSEEELHALSLFSNPPTNKEIKDFSRRFSRKETAVRNRLYLQGKTSDLNKDPLWLTYKQRPADKSNGLSCLLGALKEGVSIGEAAKRSGVSVRTFARLRRTIPELQQIFLETIVVRQVAECPSCGEKFQRRERETTKNIARLSKKRFCERCVYDRSRRRRANNIVAQISCLLNGARARHRKKFPAGPEFDLDTDYLQNVIESQRGVCAYTGRPLSGYSISTSPFRSSSESLSIDRIDSRKGYVKGNVVVCFLDANVAKGTLSYQEFLSLCRSVVSCADSAQIPT